MSICENIPDKITTKNKILVLGDLHADYQKTVDLLTYFDIIDYNKKWTGGNTIIVQLGDQIDGYGRGGFEDASGEIDILNLFDNLHLQAKQYKGAVYSLIGNHELMNVMGNFSYASKNDIKQSGGLEKRKIMYSPGGSMAQRLACTRNTILKINDIIFVHGGIIPEIVRKNKEHTIQIVNKLMKDYLNGTIGENNRDFSLLLKDYDSVLWNRSLGGSNVQCDRLNQTLKDLNANHIIIGHSTQEIINSKCNEKVWRVDVGLSKALGNNKFQILEITQESGKSKFKILT